MCISLLSVAASVFIPITTKTKITNLPSQTSINLSPDQFDSTLETIEGINETIKSTLQVQLTSSQGEKISDILLKDLQEFKIISSSINQLKKI